GFPAVRAQPESNGNSLRLAVMSTKNVCDALPSPSETLDWDALDTVLLDMDGTLLDLRFDNFFWRELVPQRYAARLGLSLAAARAELVPKFAAKHGTLD